MGPDSLPQLPSGSEALWVKKELLTKGWRGNTGGSLLPEHGPHSLAELESILGPASWWPA